MKGTTVSPLILAIIVALILLAVGYLFISGRISEIIQNTGLFPGFLSLS